MLSSIKEFDRPADRIRQHRQADERPIIVVEGPSDARLLQEAFGGSYVVFPVGNRTVALAVALQLASWKLSSFVCSVDRDFDDVVASEEAKGLPIHAYENADLEAMLVASDAFRLMIQELGSEEKLKRYGGIEALRRTLTGIVEPIARLRAANVQNRWGLAFDEVELADKIETRTLNLKLESYCAALAAKNSDSPAARTLLSWATGTKRLARTPSCPRRGTPYFRGRDFLAAAGVALRQKVGTSEKAATRAEHLAGVVRAISCPLVANSSWGTDLRSRLVE